MSLINYLVHKYLLSMAYCAPLAAVYIAATTEDQNSGTIASWFSLASCVLWTLKSSWLSCFGWLVIGIMKKEGSVKLLFAGLALVMVADATLTSWSLDENIYVITEIVCGVIGIFDFKNRRLRIEWPSLFAWFAIILRKMTHPKKTTITKTVETSHYQASFE